MKKLIIAFIVAALTIVTVACSENREPNGVSDGDNGSGYDTQVESDQTLSGTDGSSKNSDDTSSEVNTDSVDTSSEQSSENETSAEQSGGQPAENSGNSGIWTSEIFL